MGEDREKKKRATVNNSDSSKAEGLVRRGSDV